MYCVKQITNDMFWVGASDRRIPLFENAFPVPKGVSYNSYILLDEKTVLCDTVDQAVSKRFFENIDYVLQGRNLDYIIINHMEPDHCATIEDVILRHPEVKIVGNGKTLTMIKQFFDFDIDSRFIDVKEGDILDTGKHKLKFFMAPMVHWPEVMVTYDETDKVLYSADAFGTFGALNGNIFADQLNFENEWLEDARRYYTNIVGKFGVQVLGLIKKFAGLDINFICPLHGPIWRKNIDWYVNKYNLWANYAPEEKGVVIAYGSIYGNTENAADILATMLSDLGVKNIAIYDVSVTHPSYIVSDCFRYSHIVFASATYNGGIFCNMETLLTDIKAHNLQNRTVTLIENGSWALSSGKQMSEIIGGMKNITILNEPISIKSSLKNGQMDQICEMAKAIADSMK